MTQQSDPNNPEIGPWLVETLRLTAFPSAGATVEPRDWWEHVVGEAPETRNIQPRINSVQEEGEFFGGRLILTVQPQRADWLFIPAFEPHFGAPDFAQLRPFPDSLAILRKLSSQWLERSPLLQRLAFGAVLDIPTDSRPAGYRQLAQYLPSVQIDPEDSSDFLYQINRRRVSRIMPELSVNRLSKWSVATAKFLQVAVGDVPGRIEIPSEEYTLVRAELDINTAHEYRGTLPARLLPDLFEELIELGKEISTKGDAK